MKQFLTLLLCCLITALRLSAQEARPAIERYLAENKEKWQLHAGDMNNWFISDQHTDGQITYAYVQQTLNGLKLHNAVSSAVLKNGAVVIFNSRFTANAAGLANAAPGAQTLHEQDAVFRAAEHVQVTLENLKESGWKPDTKERLFTAEGVVNQPVRVVPVYQKTADQIRLAWNVEIRVKSDWWSIRVDALNGAVLEKSNYTVYCDFGAGTYGHIHKAGCTPLSEMPREQRSANNFNAQSSYRVFPYPGESPNHIAHQLITDPFDLQASPYGWHDTDGVEGAEYTITRGNNVNAVEDRDDDNLDGYSPDGGPSLVFDFPYTPVQSPVVWQDAAITNLFYANNFMHDMSYRYGFTEAAGNYQENNYDRGGLEGDAVQADAQDGSGTNNANFSAPPDGLPGRMQMYLWTVAVSDSITVHSPASVAGTYFAPRSGFGIAVSSPLTAELVLVEDNAISTSDGCDPILNGDELAGKIALIDRGGCNFVVKVKAAQDQGAVGVIVGNNTDEDPFSMGGNDPSITIPSAMVSLDVMILLKLALLDGPVSMSFEPPAGDADHDSDVDNGIIAHEYGHGISIRLTGGPSNSECLNSTEQMGEGWSDWYALATTIQPDDDRFTLRPMGTYSLGQATTGEGIRNQVYSTDLSVCTYTYGDLPATGGQVHDVGELWAAMLWDLTWDLIDAYGFDPDIFNGTGGNNIALQLVTEAMKIQPCNPGFEDGRDAILAADQIRYGGVNKCIIWNAFARRGLGFSADQGSPFDETDGIEAFDVPPFCLVAVEEPVAGFVVDKMTSCLGLATFQFTDQSQQIAQFWLWDFGDGNFSSEINPVHQYTTAGTFTVTQIVTNNIGSDTLVFSNLITVTSMPAPAAASDSICTGQSASLTATVSSPEATAEWRNSAGNIVFTGTAFVTPPLFVDTEYTVNEAENLPSQQVGPTGPGSGGNHNTTFLAEILFTAEKSITIRSALVRAQGAGEREIRLTDGSGNVIQAVTVNIPDGESRIDLNIEVPSAGSYSLGAGPNVNLYRDNSGVVYPFTIDGLVSIIGSNAGQPGFYYYFYDWEVQETPCRSAATPVTVTVTPGPTAFFTSASNGLTVSFTNLTMGPTTSTVWNFGDGTTSTQHNPVHTYTTTGIYDVVLTVSDGNCTTTYVETIDFTTGINTPQPAPFDVLLTPNPATGHAILSLSGTPGGRFTQVTLYSVDGRQVQTNRFDLWQGSTLRLGLDDLTPGMYLVKVHTENGVVMRKLVVQ